MEHSARIDYWLQTALQRLTAEGFALRNQHGFKIVAHRSQFEITKFGNVETYFIFADFDYLDVTMMRRFSTDAFNYAMQTRTSSLPCGLFESVWSFAVSIARNVDDATMHAIKTETPPSHWSAGELRVAYDAPRHQLYYFDQTPLWGAAYYAGFRRQIQKYLG
ncbi:MAG: hypothetical protein HY231_17675 [Acidobacteria bacterium]|nr:hypothetical protein [Acidobacteriota bacterium]